MFPDSFDWHTWRAGTLQDFGVTYKFDDIVRSRNLIKKYAVGFCFGEELICRPKKDTKAVMFLYNNIFFWTHLTNKEFCVIFNESKGEQI